MEVTKKHEIPAWEEMTEEQKKRLLSNIAFVCNRIAYRLWRTIRLAPDGEDMTEDKMDSDTLNVVDHIVGAVMRNDERLCNLEDDEEMLDDLYNGAGNAFKWIMAEDFCVAKAVEDGEEGKDR